MSPFAKRHVYPALALATPAWPTVQVVPPYIDRSTAIPSGALTVIPRLPSGIHDGIVNVARPCAPTLNDPVYRNPPHLERLP